MMDKVTWLVLRNPETDAGSFRNDILNDVGKIAAELVPTVSEVFITPREPDRFSSAGVDFGDGVHFFDAAIEVTTSGEYVTLDPFADYLRTVGRYAGGWRVHPTVIYDSRGQVPLGEPSELPTLFIFIERRDGTAPDFFSRNWYIHAGHPDGQEAESEESRANRHASEATAGSLYVQNRFLEPVGPTPWLAHGFTKLTLPEFVTAEALGDDVREMLRQPGEEPFDRWPARFLQGYSYRVL